jgi:putative transposase
MMEPQSGKITVKRQCELLGLARSTGYYRPRGESAENLAIMRRMDEIYTEHPFYGVRQLTRVLRREGRRVNPKRIRRLMRLMGLEAQCPRPNLSKPAPGHKVYPYLMKAWKLDGANQAWCADITYIRLEGGFVYLVAIMDWFSRKGIAWELSNTFDTAFCLKCLKQAVKTHGTPAVMNTDQGSQFTSEGWTNELARLGVTISMDGRGRALDNVFIERLWRSVKYEEVYQREYVAMQEARGHLGTYFEFYNKRRPHSSLDDRTPCEAHEGAERKRAA